MAKDIPKFKVGDLVLKNQKRNIWDAIYMANFTIGKVLNDRAHDWQDPSGHVQWTAVADIHLLMPAENIVSSLPDARAFGRACNT